VRDFNLLSAKPDGTDDESAVKPGGKADVIRQQSLLEKARVAG